MNKNLIYPNENGNSKIRVYVAGPYSSDNVTEMLDNMREGMRASTQILLHGFAPFCPWLDYHFQLMLRGDEHLSVEDYYAYSMAWLEVSDIVYMLPKWRLSYGANQELDRAKDLHIPTVFNLDSLRIVARGMATC